MRHLVIVLWVVSGCGTSSTADGGRGLDASRNGEDGGHVALDAGAIDAGALDAGAPPRADASAPLDGGPPPAPCRTRITYGSSWIHPAGHPADDDDVAGRVTWDGVCVDDGPSSYAVLSNGWRPYFSGAGACVIALDVRGDCEEPPPAECTTRVTYGSTWLHGPGHPAQHDDVRGALSWDGVCRSGSGGAFAQLSNGWQPHFAGACSMSFRYEQCGGLFANPVIARDCPDPGVARDGARYVMSCTGGGGGNTYRIRTSTDLVRWTEAGWIFPAGTQPSWATGDYWAPELHRVGSRWVAYFSARHRDGSLAVGAATAPDALGPYTDLGHPLVHEAYPGVIDAHHYQAPDGAHYLLWKRDGNAVGQRTPMFIQRIAADGVTRMGSPTEILSNDRTWEGDLVEGPWMIDHGGFYYLFYSANAYASTRYAVGVARASSPLGPFTKAPAPILTSNAFWAGPGHGSVIEGPSGALVHVYHAWVAGRVGASPGREVLVDRITFADGWPRMLSAPSARSQPLP